MSKGKGDAGHGRSAGTTKGTHSTAGKRAVARKGAKLQAEKAKRTEAGTRQASAAKSGVTDAGVLSAARSFGPSDTPVKLSDLRAKLPGSRAEQDAAIRKLHENGKIRLYRDDNSYKRTQRDEDAAYMTGGQPRHILYVAR